MISNCQKSGKFWNFFKKCWLFLSLFIKKPLIWPSGSLSRKPVYLAFLNPFPSPESSWKSSLWSQCWPNKEPFPLPGVWRTIQDSKGCHYSSVSPPLPEQGTVEIVISEQWSWKVSWFLKEHYCSAKNHTTLHDDVLLVTFSTVKSQTFSWILQKWTIYIKLLMLYRKVSN